MFQLFRFYIETERFNISIESKQTEDQPKQFDREHILVFFLKILGFSGLFWFVSKQFVSVVFRFYTETESFDVWIELKQTEDIPKQYDREHIFFPENLGLFQFVSVCYKIVMKQTQIVCSKQTEIQPKQILFRLKPKFVCLFQGFIGWGKVGGGATLNAHGT